MALDEIGESGKVDSQRLRGSWVCEVVDLEESGNRLSPVRKDQCGHLPFVQNW